ncbi:glycosyltransferase [Methylocystis parvus]|uniref:Glycosyltransferase n=2 Tax=Methylocystis parvus TaxID=134 RepID=A0A6B8MA12_9HYPH|nr:glycosyltransferase [Methylocystis parvus]
MPTHKGELWIDATLASLAAQDEAGMEVVLVDSSPTSATLDIARRYADRLDLRLYERKDMLPWPAKVNFAVAEARAPFVSILHQDDIWLDGRAAKIRGLIGKNPEAALFLHAAAIIDGDGRVLGALTCPLPAENMPVSKDLLIERLIVQNFVAMPAPTFRRDVFLDAGGMDEKRWYTADWDLYLKLALAGSVFYSADILAGFRIHGGSLTISGSRSIDDFRSQHEIVLDRHASRIPTERRERILRMARASIAVNVALAQAAHGEHARLVTAAIAILRLGPIGALRYLRFSRLVERVAPRLRARFAGRL